MACLVYLLWVADLKRLLLLLNAMLLGQQLLYYMVCEQLLHMEHKVADMGGGIQGLK